MADRILPSGAVVNMLGQGAVGSSSNTTTGTDNYGAGAGRGFVNPDTRNAFSHQTNNITPGSEQAYGTDTSDISVEFQPNLLDNYDSITYHWKFFITSIDALNSGKVTDPLVQTMIAESGVTDATIDNVSITSVATPTQQTGTGTSTEIKFEIVEPSGAGLIDKIFYQSVSLGILNWTTVPFFLQLEFRARDPKTSNSDTNLGAEAISNLKWLWPIKLTDLRANVTTVGTRYSFTGLFYPEMVQSNAYFSIQHNISLKTIATVGSALKELEDKLNLDQQDKLIDNYGVADIYRIHVDGEIALYNLTPHNSNINSKRNNSYEIFDEKSANFNTNTSIDKIIDSLLANTSEFQTSIVHSITPGQEGVSINQEPSQMKKFWRIVTDVRILKFDARRNDYARQFDIYVIPYDIGLLQANVFQSDDETKETSVKRFLTYIKKNILKKKYNYIFTGLNDQIKSFDLNFNFAFAYAVARFGGIYINSSMPDIGVVNNTQAEDEKKITQRLRRVISLQHTAPNSTRLIKSIDDYHEAINASNLSDEQKERFTKLLNAQKSEDAINISRVGKSTTFENSRKNSQALAKPVKENVPAFVSDVDIRSTSAINTYTEFITERKGNIRPVPHLEQVQDASVGQGVEPNSNSGIAKLSTMFSIALHSGSDLNLISIKLTIKGDPYWLFPGPVELNGDSIHKIRNMTPANAIEFLKNNQKYQNSSVNIMSTDNFILIRFRSPRVYPNTDSAQSSYSNESMTDVETYSGVYKVLFVTSKFEMGKFEQVLECVLDTVINIRDISALIEEDARKLDIPVTVEGFRNERGWSVGRATSANINVAPVANIRNVSPSETLISRLNPRSTNN